MGCTGWSCSGVDQERNTQKHNPDLPDEIEEKHFETPKETDDTNDTDNVPMSETPMNDGRDASHIKAKSSVDNTNLMVWRRG